VLVCKAEGQCEVTRARGDAQLLGGDADAEADAVAAVVQHGQYLVRVRVRVRVRVGIRVKVRAWQQLSSMDSTLLAYSWPMRFCASRSPSSFGSEGDRRPTAGESVSPLAGCIWRTTEAWS
tara:strand:- start:110 stop:472 length:363 start_codon:yes stop_codon:yes gene_type:complete